MSGHPEEKRGGAVTCKVWPHKRSYATTGGPVGITISQTNQPESLKEWPNKKQVYMMMEQPDHEKTNATILRILFSYVDPSGMLLKPPLDIYKWYRRPAYIKGNHELGIYVRQRITKGLPHPIPTGQWSGIVEEQPSPTCPWVMYTYGKVTLDVATTTQAKPKYSTIIKPGDPLYEETRRIKNV